MDKLKPLLYLLLLTNLTHCQMKKDLAPFYVDICHPDNKYLVTPILDEVITLEGNHAGLPYGSTSTTGLWGQSGSVWTEQHGTPIGADIVYYAEYEDTFYHLKADFGVEKIQDYLGRAYATEEDPVDETQRYIRRERPTKLFVDEITYQRFSKLIFGFAPQGVVYVWLGYAMGGNQIEIGRFQAEKVTNTQKIQEYTKRYRARYGMSEEFFKELAQESFRPEASSALWDSYRHRSNWRFVIRSENPNFRLFEGHIAYYNGEHEMLFRPWIVDSKSESRAIPKFYFFNYETGKGEKWGGEIFFDDEVMLEKLKNGGDILVNISADNRSMELSLNGEKLEVQTARITTQDEVYKESYK